MKQTYFPHDSNSKSDIKIIAMRKIGGWEYYGIYFALLELLFTEENKLSVNDYEIIAFGLQCDADKLKQIVEDFELFEIKGKSFFSRRLGNTIDEIHQRSEKARENALKRWNKNADAMPSQSRPFASKVNESKSKVNKSILNKIEAFENAVHSFFDFDINERNKFVDYWTEKNKSGTQFRAQMEKTFDIKRRLTRWCSMDFKKEQKINTPLIYQNMKYKKN